MRDLVVSCLNAVTVSALIFLAAGVLFNLLEDNFKIRRLNKNWRSSLLDIQFFFFNLLLPPIVNFTLGAIPALALAKRRPHVGLHPLTFALELLALLLAFDLWTYIRHRTFHSKLLWRVHSIHHSSEELNWVSGLRNHSAEVVVDLIGEFFVFTAAALVGADRRVLLTAGVFIGVWNFFIHANLRWTFGPLRYIFASPVLHHWHHSDQPEAMDRNFAVMFSWIDVVLGTFYMPRHTLPETTGLMGQEKKKHPRTFFAQLIYPFRRHGRHRARHSRSSPPAIPIAKSS